MRITLIGFMGSGKSTVAALLGAELGLPVVELDELTLKVAGRSSIAEIFAAEGEDRFRTYEAEALKSLASAENLVLSTGGGVVMHPENEGFIKTRKGVTVYLEAGFAEIVRRLKGGAGRPLFQDQAAARALFDRRRPLYEGLADLRVATDGKTPAEVADDIRNRLVERMERS